MKIKRIAIVMLLTLFAANTYADLIQMGVRGDRSADGASNYNQIDGQSNGKDASTVSGDEAFWLKGDSDHTGVTSVNTNWVPHSIGSCIRNQTHPDGANLAGFTIIQSDSCLCGSSACSGSKSNNTDQAIITNLCNGVQAMKAKDDSVPLGVCADPNAIFIRVFSSAGDYARAIRQIQTDFEAAVNQFNSNIQDETQRLPLRPLTEIVSANRHAMNPARFYQRIDDEVIAKINDVNPDQYTIGNCSQLSDNTSADPADNLFKCNCPSAESNPLTAPSLAELRTGVSTSCNDTPDPPGPVGPNRGCGEQAAGGQAPTGPANFESMDDIKTYVDARAASMKFDLSNYQDVNQINIAWLGKLTQGNNTTMMEQQAGQNSGGGGGIGNYDSDPTNSGSAGSYDEGGYSTYADRDDDDDEGQTRDASDGFYQTTRKGRWLRKCEMNAESNWADVAGEMPGSGSFTPAYRYVVKQAIRSYAEHLNSDDNEYIPFLIQLNAHLNPENGTQGSNPIDCPGQEVTFADSLKNTVKSKVDAYNNKLKEALTMIVSKRNLIARCDALALMTTYSDFEDGYEELKTTKKSHDGKIECKTYGNDTQDYPKCKEALDMYDVSTVAKATMHEVQNVNLQGRNMERMGNLNRPVEGAGPAGGPGLDHSAMLEAQRDGIDDMKNVATHRAVFDTAKATTFAALAIAIPTPKKLMNQCEDHAKDITKTNNEYARDSYESFKKDIVDKMLTGMQVTQKEEFVRSHFDIPTILGATSAPDDPNTTASNILNGDQGATFFVDSGAACGVALRQERVLLKNSSAIDQAEAIAAEALVSAGVNAAKADILKKQIKTLNGIITAVDEYAPEGAPGLQTDEFMIEECQFNPAAEGCQGATPEFARAVGFNGGSLNVATNGGNMATGQINPNGDGNGTNNSATGNSRPSGSKFNSGLGGFVDGVDKGPGGKANTVAAARAKAGGSNNIGNAGLSGGGAGGARAATGGGSRGGGGKGGGARAAAYGGKYKQGGASGIAGFYSGAGRGARGRKPASGGGNPFSKLFGKKGANKNGSLSFRGPAGIGGKKGSIFDRISSRYKVVNSKDRLLEYK